VEEEARFSQKPPPREGGRERGREGWVSKIRGWKRESLCLYKACPFSPSLPLFLLTCRCRFGRTTTATLPQQPRRRELGNEGFFFLFAFPIERRVEDLGQGGREGGRGGSES